ncbi:MAG: phosphoesterase [Candidatus Kapaibacterium sp.]|nr:MAG: phosphoesterase [Candidatus Kapabacteria bacterium]
MPEAQQYFVFALLGTLTVAGVLGLALVHRWKRTSRRERALATSVAAFVLGVVGYWLLGYKALPPLGGHTTWMVAWVLAIAGGLWLVLSACLALALPAHVHEERRRFLRNGIAASIGVVVSSRVASYDPADVVIERHDAYLPSLPLSDDGMTLAVLSDIHAGPFIEPKHVAYYATLINDAKPDLILLPGDFITARAEELLQYRSALSALRASRGVFAVLGNHDYFNAAAPHVAAMLKQWGITLLNDRSVGLDSLELFGISDERRFAVEQYCRDQKPQPLFERLVHSQQPLVLVHRPFVFDALAAVNPRVLVIAGHTHGGQICAELPDGQVVAVNRLFSPYVRGWYRTGTAQLYVTRGVGTIGLPLRIGAPPEITFITLRR